MDIFHTKGNFSFFGRYSIEILSFYTRWVVFSVDILLAAVITIRYMAAYGRRWNSILLTQLSLAPLSFLMTVCYTVGLNT